MAEVKYIDWLSKAVAPGFFQRLWGLRFMQVAGMALDSMVSDAKLGIKSRFPSLAPDDALGYVGEGRNMDGYRAETIASFRAAVVDAWRQWATAGTVGDNDTGLINKFRRLGYPGDIQIVPWYQAVTLTPGPPAEYAAWWSAFWVVITDTRVTALTWGAPGLVWGGNVPSPVGNPTAPATWGSNLNAIDVAELRKVIHKWKAAHEICPHIIFRPTVGTAVFASTNVRIGARYHAA